MNPRLLFLRGPTAQQELAVTQLYADEPRRLADIIHVNKHVVPLVRPSDRRTFQMKNWKRTTETMQQLNPCQARVQQRKSKHDSPRVWQNIKLSGEIFCVLTPLSTP